MVCVYSLAHCFVLLFCVCMHMKMRKGEKERESPYVCVLVFCLFIKHVGMDTLYLKLYSLRMHVSFLYSITKYFNFRASHHINLSFTDL